MILVDKAASPDFCCFTFLSSDEMRVSYNDDIHLVSGVSIAWLQDTVSLYSMFFCFAACYMASSDQEAMWMSANRYSMAVDGPAFCCRPMSSGGLRTTTACDFTHCGLFLRNPPIMCPTSSVVCCNSFPCADFFPWPGFQCLYPSLDAKTAEELKSFPIAPV